ncbi:lamin tail domain-containing protein [Ahniella affigens]|nr:lamin tail domain-containing protein [Ahniella affigens]
MAIRILTSFLLGLCALVPATSSFAQTADPLFSNQFETGAATFSPELVYAREGTTTNGLGGPLVIRLAEPALVDTFVPIVSMNITQVTVVGGGATVLAGETDAVVTINALVANPQPAVLRATLGNVVYGSVRVVADSEPRNVVSIRPSPARIAAGGSRLLIARLDLPAPLNGTTVDLSVDPLAAGTFPTTVTVPTDSFSASFSYTDQDVAEISTLSGSVGAGPAAQGQIVQSPVGKLVINEVDYDQQVSDSTEFIEIFNRSPDAVPLDGMAVVLVNGTDSTEYNRFNLGDAAVSLPSGGYLLLATTGTEPPPDVPFIDFGTDSIVQNGAPDAIAIVDTEAGTILDALSYEGDVTAALIDGFTNPVNLVEGTSLVALDDGSGTGSLARLPNGTDNNNANTDFSLAVQLTPGFSNDPVVASGHLVINEVDYDQVSTDTAEFIELFNASNASIDLTDYRVALVNGSNNLAYTVVDLASAGSLAPGAFLAIVSNNVNVVTPPGVARINFTGSTDQIQNGAPDGIALIKGTGAGAELIDALSYEGGITVASIPTISSNPFNLVEGTQLAVGTADSNSVVGSLGRDSLGTDTNEANTDWSFKSIITPGAAN